MLDDIRPHTATIVDCLANLTLSRDATKQVGIIPLCKETLILMVGPANFN